MQEVNFDLQIEHISHKNHWHKIPVGLSEAMLMVPLQSRAAHKENGSHPHLDQSFAAIKRNLKYT